MILDNPFHVLGVLANCGTRVKAKREAQIKRYLEVRKPLVFQDDLYFPGCHRNEATVDRALRALHDARDRIGPGLFWFTRGNVLDDHGIRLLAEGDLSGALAIWQRIEDRPPTRNYASSLNNFGTICLLITLAGKSPGQRWSSGSSERVDYLRRGLQAKARLVGGLTGQDLSAFCATFSDEMATRDPEDITAIFAESLEQFKGEAEKYGLELPTSTLVALLDSGGPRTAGLKQRFALGPRQELERAIRASEATYTQDASKAAGAGKQLMTVARAQLPELAAIVSETEFAYTSLADRVADELLDAAVAYFNHHLEADAVSLRVASASLSLVRYAVDIACGATVHGRAQENLDSVKGIERDLRRQRDMERVRTPMRTWFDRAAKLFAAHPSPDEQISFVRQALGGSGGQGTSAIALMRAVRRQGSKTFGVAFRGSDEMLDCGSLVCTVLVNHAVSAFNAASSPRTASAAAELLPQIDSHFVAEPSVHPHASDLFLVSDKCFDHLKENLFAARKWLAQHPSRNVPARSGGSGGSGCLVAVVGLIGLLVVFVGRGLPGARHDAATGEEPQFSAGAVSSPTGLSRPGAELVFRMPPVAAGRVLSLAEVRWCVREEQAVDRSERRLSLRRRANSDSEVAQYNEAVDQHNTMVARYNSRCGQFSYRPGDLERAKREVAGLSR